MIPAEMFRAGTSIPTMNQVNANLGKDFVIVIGRQFGAGGRKLGRLLSERLGIPYYDKELLSQAAERYGFRKEFFDHVDERKPSLLQSILAINISSPTADYSTSAVNSSSLYEAQSSVIRQLADEGPCIIVGRTADYVLRDRANLLSVFVHADIDVRARRTIDRAEASDHREALAILQKRDKEREDYYNYFTGRKWGAACTYHLSFDSTRLTPEAMADIVEAYIAARRPF